MINYLLKHCDRAWK